MTFKYLNVSEAVAAMSAIHANGVERDALIQQVCEAAICHTNLEAHNNNASLGIKLADCVLPRERAKVVVYLCKHGKFDYVKKSLVFQHKTTVETDAEKLAVVFAENHWSAATPDQQPEQFLDLDARVQSLLKAIAKAAKDGKEIRHSTPMAELLFATASGDTVTVKSDQPELPLEGTKGE